MPSKLGPFAARVQSEDKLHLIEHRNLSSSHSRESSMKGRSSKSIPILLFEGCIRGVKHDHEMSGPSGAESVNWPEMPPTGPRSKRLVE